mmetsp:Transcript_4668/g.7775  ORF Transcript_4668/g.7775 Transcript_4668/m.7775 type:complete len:132 (+) Transcript_4668:93-488(+)|eukprot:CAMPEP_0119003298 /NCGR_PEP_ID=MMETSP1176-20130426/482_1 /TAXON_ID=265551 /ORGANISM="Synedropsis recta cf, Strain CCMP1620" /LENGTH=131 /DNA_ID=CAMNT_0006954887 /DNA_START=92 /DNA_END=487 /DNA_ORIENTATION=+
MSTTHTWSCICESFKGEVTGDPKLAVFCHCGQCRKYASTAMQLAIWDPSNFKVIKGDDNIFDYESAPETFRKSCKTCGSFVYKTIKKDATVVPIGALEGGPAINPTCHIFCADKGDNNIPFPDLPQHDGFP